MKVLFSETEKTTKDPEGLVLTTARALGFNPKHERWPRHPYARLDVAIDSELDRSRFTYEFSAHKNSKKQWIPYVRPIDYMMRYPHKTFLRGSHAPYYPSDYGQHATLKTPLAIKAVAAMEKFLAKEYGFACNMPEPFTIQKWHLYNRFPGYKLMVDHGVEPEFPPGWHTWWEGIIRQPTPERLIKYVYGEYNRARLKHFVSYIGRPAGWRVAWVCRMLRGVVPPDYLLSLEYPEEAGFARADNQGARYRYVQRDGWHPIPEYIGYLDKVLLNVTPRRAIRTAREALEGIQKWGFFVDSLQLANNQWPEGLRVTGGVQDLHEQLIARVGDRVVTYRGNRIRSYAPPPVKEVPQTAVLKKLDGMKLGKYHVVTPKTTEDIRNWGSTGRHCLGGYAENAARGTYTILAVYEGDKLVANIATNAHRILDFRGSGNSVVPIGIQKELLPILMAEKVLDPGQGLHPLYHWQRELSDLDLLTTIREMSEKAEELKKSTKELAKV
ncbi:MAG TPA: PcfJ domain-containing protein [Nitrososphaera sp.]|nr:PcfJ domain-containing protein [Nitrososphaera sp.]